MTEFQPFRVDFACGLIHPYMSAHGDQQAAVPPVFLWLPQLKLGSVHVKV
jgi:hypothetical protein